jgi:hypothetical protein
MKTLPLFAIILSLAIAPMAHAVTISPAIPGINSNGAGTPPGAWVANFYQFALLIGGIMAFGAIVYGGVLHAISAGNPSRQSEGKKWIMDALLGLLLLAGAYIILNTVNPNLLNLNLPTLSPIDTQTNNTAPPTVNCTTNSSGQRVCNGQTVTPVNPNNPIIINPHPVIGNP